MKSLVLILIFCALNSLVSGVTPAIENSELEVEKFLQDVNQNLATLYNREVLANWQNEIKGPNDLIAMLESEIATKDIMRYIRSISSKVTKFKKYPIQNEDLMRQMNLIPKIGYEVLPKEDLELLYAVTNNMSEIYQHAKLCSYRDQSNCNLKLIPDIQNILHGSQDVDEIEYYWSEWRKKTGMAAKEDFLRFVDLYRKTAKLNGFTKASDFWYKDLPENSSAIMTMLDQFMNELQPFFEQFHAYVRGQLRKKYGLQLIRQHQPYPQHLAEILIGNAFRFGEQEYQMDLPFPSVQMPNITENLLKSGIKNAELNYFNAKEFFRTIGMPELESSFWSDSCAAKQDLNDDHCWHKAWKFYGSNHVNFSYCPLMTVDTFYNMFEALSDVYYYKSYQKLLTLYQEEPLPNFSDAIGKFFSLMASSPKYLKNLNITDDSYMTKEARINRLYVQGLRTIFLIPVFYILERYRLDILDKKISMADNCAYWDLTETYSGAAPPVKRRKSDFDAPAKLLMEVDDQYTTQILSTILQYQLLEYYCTLTGKYIKGDESKPLDLCDLTGHHVVGERIFSGMSVGSSKSLKDILKVLVGSDQLNINGLLDYYQPLHEWLVEQNQLENNEIGWDKSDMC